VKAGSRLQASHIVPAPAVPGLTARSCCAVDQRCDCGGCCGAGAGNSVRRPLAQVCCCWCVGRTRGWLLVREASLSVCLCVVACQPGDKHAATLTLCHFVGLSCHARSPPSQSHARQTRESPPGVCQKL
jgi:hypothetical protein